MPNIWKPKSSETSKMEYTSSFLGSLKSLYKSPFVTECLLPEQMQGLAEMHEKGDLHVYGEHKKTIPLKVGFGINTSIS